MTLSTSLTHRVLKSDGALPQLRVMSRSLHSLPRSGPSVLPSTQINPKEGNMPSKQKHNIAVPPYKPVSSRLRKALRSAIPNTPGVLTAPTAKEIAKMAREERAEPIEFIRDEAHGIEKWPDHKFSTEDGRTFGMFLWGDSILKRIEATGRAINRKDKEGVRRIEHVAGFILEIGSDDPPLIFDDFKHLCAAWAETHAVYGVEPTEEEFNELDLPDLWPDDEDEEDVKR